MKIFLIFIILHTLGNESSANAADKHRNNLEKGNHYNSERENRSFENRLPRRTKEAKGGSECPQNIYPCTCYVDTTTFGVMMDCSDVTTELELQAIFEQPFPQNDMDQFLMDQKYINSNISDLPLGVFGSKTFVNVQLKSINFNFNFHTFNHMNATLSIFYVNSATFDNSVVELAQKRVEPGINLYQVEVSIIGGAVGCCTTCPGSQKVARWEGWLQLFC